MPETDNSQQENMGKIIEGNYPSSKSNLDIICVQRTRPLETFVSMSMLHCAPSMMSSLLLVSDEVILPSAVEEVVSLTLWNLSLTIGTEKTRPSYCCLSGFGKTSSISLSLSLTHYFDL